MASRAILRKRTFIDQYVNASSSTTSILRRVIHTHNYSTSPSSTTTHVNGYNRISQSLKVYGLGQYIGRRGLREETTSEFNALMCVRWMSQSAAAAAKQPEPEHEPGSEDDEMVGKKRKEASPEECDQAVEGLTTVKAKAKAKRSQESQKGVQFFLQRVWAVFLGIGPALRAVASMNRLVD